MNQLQAEMKRIRDLLPRELFEGSKDWCEGNTVERIEWLLSMYESSKQEVRRLEKQISDDSWTTNPDRMGGGGWTAEELDTNRSWK